MRLRCVGGPMDGAKYVLSSRSQSTTRKPDRIGFDFIDDRGMHGHYEYIDSGTEDNGTGVDLIFKYYGIIMDTAAPFEKREQEEERQPDDACAYPNLGGWTDCQEAVKFKARRAEVSCKFCRKELAEAQSYADLAESGGIAGAP